MLPTTLQKICEFAFHGAFNLEDVIVPGTWEFDITRYLRFVRVRRELSLGRIDMKVYRNMRILVLPEALEVVENWFKFSGVRKVIFPSTIKEISRCAFAGCKQLKEIRFEQSCQLRCIRAGAFQ